MHKLLMRLLVAGAAWVAATPISQAQQPGQPAPTVASLKRDLRRIAAYDYYYAPDFDIIGLTDRTARRLVAYLKTHDLSAAASRQMGLGSVRVAAPVADASHLRVYGITYGSGGTRGDITIPVLQWQNAAGQRFAYRLPAEDGFYGAYRLAAPGRKLYLLLGEFTGASPMICDHAYVVELKGDRLLSKVAIFGTKPNVCLCNVPMDFDPARQTLHLDLTRYNPNYGGELPPEWGRPTGKALAVKFSNGHFVRSR